GGGGGGGGGGPREAAAGGPAGLYVFYAGGRGVPAAVCLEGLFFFGLPETPPRRSVQQEVGSGQKAKARPRSAEPLELVIGGQRARRKCQNWKRRAAFLTGGLDVGFQPEHPGSKLIVVPGLDAADDAVHLLGFRHIDAEADKTAGTIAFRLALAVADVAAEVEAGPAIHGQRRRAQRVS